MKFKIGATIPVVQYGNIMPEIEVEADTYEEAYSRIMPYIEQMWKQFAEPDKQLRPTSRILLDAFVGGQIYYDDVAHVYTNEAGEVYLSGSQYAKQFERPFDMATMSKRVADKVGAQAKDVADMWQLKSTVSTGFGTAIHGAMELYGRFGGLADSLNKTTHVHDHPVIKKAVESFYAAHKDKALCEVLVVDHAKKHAGRIDRLVVLGDKHGRVEDYKTNATIEKDLAKYWKQLGFYSDILRAAGWKMEPEVIHHWDGEWHEYVQ